MLGAEGITSGVSISAPLAAKAGATVQGKPDARLKNMAGEMEATFLSMLLKEMRATLDSENEGGGLFPGDTGDVQGGLFDLYLGRHMAEAGGVGMATALVRQMSESGGATAKTDQQRDTQRPTAIDPGRVTPSAATR
jgi:peptidoglycan hydrolase FlgJ